MTRNLFIDFLRTIRYSLNRFLSILAIVAIGVAVFAGLRSSAPDMMYTMDRFYDDNNVMDVQIMSTLGLTKEDIEVIRNVEGVEAVQPGYFKDALSNTTGSELVFRLHSIPQGYASDPDKFINKLIVKEGRLPEKPDEIVLEKSLNFSVGFKLGDKITFTSGTDTPITKDALKTDTFRIVGFVQTPFYLTYEKGNSLINSIPIDLYAYLPSDSFAYEGYYLDCFVKVKGAKALNAFNDEYARLITKAHDNLVNVGVDRAKARGEELRKMAQAQLDEGTKKYEAGLAEYNKKIADGEKQLNDGYTKLIKGEGDLKTEREKARLQIENGEKQIRAGEEQLNTAASQIANGRKQLNDAQALYNSAQAQYESTMEASAGYRSQLKELEKMMATLVTNMEEIQKQIDTATEPAEIERLKELLGMYQTLHSSLDREYQRLKKLNQELDATVATVENALSQTRIALDNAQAQLDEAQAQYDEGASRLAAGRAELAAGKAQMAKGIAEGEKKLKKGWEDYNAAKAKFDKEKADGQKKLKDAEQQLIDARLQIERIKDANWYVLDRNFNYGFASYKSTVRSMAAIGRLIPVFFLLVAMLVCTTTLTRMVNEDRINIGTYKALGYGNNTIILKYIFYVLAASLLGGTIGSAAGSRLFPYAVYNAWSAMYCQPPLMQRWHFDIIAVSILVTTAVMLITAYYTARVELIQVPSQLMRPKAPKPGKKTFLEFVPSIWERLNFSQKVTMRNLFRYKKRMAMTVIGILGCAALLLAGLGMNDTIGTVVANQFDKVFRYDLSVVTENTSSAEKLEKDLAGMKDIESSGRIGSSTVSVANKKQTESATLYVTEKPEDINKFILLQERVSEKGLKLDDKGIIITEKLAEQLKVREGDAVSVTDVNGITKNIPVSGITENYVFHYAYMSQKAYASYFYKGLNQNELLIRLKGTTVDKDELISRLRSRSGVVSVTNYSDLAANFNDTVTAMKSIVFLIIVCAALLAFVVLYNLTNININERIRELATIKVLGFKGGEVAMYIYRETFIMMIAGVIIGLFAGIQLHHLVMKSIEQSNIMFGYVISPVSYGLAALLTCVFTILVMIYMYPKLIKIPMVESLKSIE